MNSTDLCRVSAKPVGTEPVTGDRRVVEVDDSIGEDLERVASLPRDQNDIARPGIDEGRLDGPGTIHLNERLARPVKAAEEIVDDSIGILGSGISQGHDQAVGGSFGGGGEQAALRAIAASLPAEHAMNPPSGDPSQGIEGLEKLLGSLAVIDPDVEVLAFIDGFESAGNRLARFKSGGDEGRVDS